MNPEDDSTQADEQRTIRNLTQAYMQDEGLPEHIAEARAKAEVNRLAGRTDDAFGASPEVREKKGGFQNDDNDPSA